MDVQIAEQNSVAGVGYGPFLTFNPGGDNVRRQRDDRNLAVELRFGTPVHDPKRQNQQNQAKNDTKTAFFQPSHAAASIERQRPESKQLGYGS